MEDFMDKQEEPKLKITRSISSEMLNIPGRENLESQLSKLKDDNFQHHNALDKTKDYYNIVKNINISIEERMEDFHKEIQEIQDIMKSSKVRGHQWDENKNIWYKVSLIYDKAISHIYSAIGAMNWQWRFVAENRCLMDKLTGLVQKSYETGKEQVEGNLMLQGIREMKSQLENFHRYEQELAKTLIDKQGDMMNRTMLTLVEGLKSMKIGMAGNNGIERQFTPPVNKDKPPTSSTDSQVKKKLSEEDIDKIKRLIKDGVPYAEIGSEFDISDARISQIKKTLN